MRLLDLYCGAGGSAMGYHRSGFTEIVGLDVILQPRYPFEFKRKDVVELDPEFLLDFDFINASPPCQQYTVLNNYLKREYEDLVGMTRDLLIESGKPYIIENVPQAPLINPVQLCGGYFGLGTGEFYLMRHRHFESNLELEGTPCNHFKKYAIGVYGHGRWDNNKSDNKGRRGGYQGSAAENAEAMQIDWMTRNEISQAIPPAYTEYLGRQVMKQLL